MSIYIPLCLYFNHINNDENYITVLFTFHYVSILMLKIRQNQPLTVGIYIPLCLYFNSKVDLSLQLVI